MNTGMELMGMKECRECGDPYTVAEGDTGVCGGCVMGREFTALRAQLEAVTRERDGLAQTISINARETATLALRIATLERERDAARRRAVGDVRLVESAELHRAWEREVSRWYGYGDAAAELPFPDEDEALESVEDWWEIFRFFLCESPPEMRGEP